MALQAVFKTQSKKLSVLLPWISNNKHKTKEKFKKSLVLLQSCLLRADGLAVIWNTAVSCQNDNLWYHQWWQSCQIDIFFSVKISLVEIRQSYKHLYLLSYNLLIFTMLFVAHLYTCTELGPCFPYSQRLIAMFIMCCYSLYSTASCWPSLHDIDLVYMIMT